MFKRISDKQLVRYLSGTCSEKAKQKIENRLQRDLNFAQFMSTFKAIWQAENKDIQIKNLDEKWLLVKSKAKADLVAEQRKAKSTQKKKISKPLHQPAWAGGAGKLKLALVSLAILVGSFYLMDGMSWINHNESEQGVQYKTIRVAHGERSRVELPDGTSILLDAGSELRYPNVFADFRKVFLKGEAFFDVTHDKDRPFRVIANHAEIHVLGTQFNVRAWNENPSVSVAVVQGKVSLGHAESNENDPAILTKGYHSSLAKKGAPAKPSMVDVQEYLDWIHYEIRFRDASVKEVLAQFHHQIRNTLSLHHLQDKISVGSSVCGNHCHRYSANRKNDWAGG